MSQDNALSDDFIDGLLAHERREGKHTDTPIKSKGRPKLALIFDPQHATQEGPVRYVDKEMRCAQRGCSSPTYIKVNGLPRCLTHALRDTNNMLVEAGFRGAT